MSEYEIQMSEDYYSETEGVLVENRGGFGKIYVYHPGGLRIEAVLMWAAPGGRGSGRVSESGVVECTLDQRGRAVRALVETPYGAKALGVEQRFNAPPEVEESEAVKAIRDAIRIPGIAPGHHARTMARHRKEWPVLWRAIDKLLEGK